MDLESILWPLVSIAGLFTSIIVVIELYRTIRDSRATRDRFMVIGARDTLIEISRRLELRLRYFDKLEKKLKTNGIDWIKELREVISSRKKGAKKP